MPVTNPRGGRQNEERKEGGGTTESRMVQFKYGAGVPMVWSVWCNDHRAQLQFRLNLKLLKITAAEGPVRWALQSDDLERPLTQRTGLLADLRAWLWHQSRTRARDWIPHEDWQERRNNMCDVPTYSIDCGCQWPAQNVPICWSLTLTQCQRRAMI